MIQLAIYGAGVIFGIGKVFSHSEDTLRQDAELVTNINRTIIRICFWIVLLTGVADALLAFMRVENLLIYFVDKKTVASLGFPNFVVPYV
ncbi:MAG: permease, partial [Paracoccaceae bacterium]|nr:permease [Paracoccaceae bacterium]